MFYFYELPQVLLVAAANAGIVVYCMLVFGLCLKWLFVNVDAGVL